MALITTTMKRKTSLTTGGFTHWEPLREGAPAPLPWLPLMDLPLATDEPLKEKWPTLKPEIEQILSRNHIAIKHLAARNRTPFADAKYRPTTMRQNHTTVLVITHGEHNNRWFDAIDEIRVLLCDINLSHVSVEIVDIKAIQEKRLAPVPQNDSIHDIWPSIQSHVYTILGKISWTCIDIVCKGYASELVSTFLTTIVITLPLDNYSPTEEESKLLKDLCVQSNLSHVDIEFRHATLWLLGDHSGVHMNPCYEKIVNLGRGISVDGPGSPSNGTFGGYVELYTEDSEKRKQSKGVYGLTCWHVVEPGILDDEMREYYNQNGMNKEDEQNKNITLLCPGKTLHFSNAASLDKTIAKYRDDPNLQDKITALSFQRDAEIQAWNDHRHLGHILCASGYKRNSQNHRLDWALIDVNHDRIGTNNIPSSSHWYTVRGCLSGRVPFYQDLTNLGPHCRISEYVYKVGNATGLSIGEYSQTTSHLRFPGESESSVSTEYAFLGINRGDFAAPGDSGSFVFDQQCRLVGMVLAGNDMQCNPGVTYVTDIRDLVEDIEKKTGYKVGLPADVANKC